MAPSIQLSNEINPNVDSADTTQSTFEGSGSHFMTCPRIRKSHCNFYHWDTNTGKHVDRPCTFTFVSEMAYQRHIVEMHSFSYDWMKRWYIIEDKRKPVEGEVAGRLPRYPPTAGPSIIDRKAREDPKKMIKLLNSIFGL
ncbi:hypothetical protein N0V93_006104 [Gnomoniopsis smithogilvyi]|uniref:Uncharacterized protein n=1 Tax=Gnomoniopsis smithogilvyi TaxID=1191159 RepID=A0A9W8YN06_9PEZI|nr:hypothetical protein N0V93_006104 [Gnomoniopsis smithogilvyi]